MDKNLQCGADLHDQQGPWPRAKRYLLTEAASPPEPKSTGGDHWRNDIMRPISISLGIAVLGLSTALAALPAFAQTSGDQGAGVTTHHHMLKTGRAHRNVHTSWRGTGSAAANEQARVPGGQSSYNYPVGRGVNDGGMNYSAHTESPTGGQRTGSASNQEASTPAPGGNIYAFGGQGQPPGTGYHYPVGRGVNDGGMGYSVQNQGGAAR
jgi:hypothetical protein